MIFAVVALLVVFFATFLATGRVRLFAIKQKVLDIPNHRSSHTGLIPRGGGLAIVMVCVLAWSALQVFQVTHGYAGLWICLGGIVVAVVGGLDDRGYVPVVWRVMIHMLAAIVLVVGVGRLEVLQVGSIDVSLGPLAYLISVLGVTWLLNLYNFMDGIDGLAATETIYVSSVAAVLLWSRGADGLAMFSAVLAAGTLGFVYWNWPPAKLFLGDVGSGFLGFTLAALALWSDSHGFLSIWVWLILLSVFVVDATFTLARRAIRGQRLFEAHRSHAYQHAARRLGAHAPVTWGVVAINLVWLTPIAIWVANGHLRGFYGLLIAYSPLLVLAYSLRAGVSDEN